VDKKMKVIFIVPCFNAEKNLDNLSESLISQKEENWSCIFIDDISEDNTVRKMKEIASKDKRFHVQVNEEKKFALRNIVENARLFQERSDVIVAVIDGDDQLCNDETVSILIDEYRKGYEVVWTGHRWDINGMNISKSMPENVDPYSWGWCSSHLRTFSSKLISEISDINFKDTNGKWFKRGYDQALMLPVISVSKSRKYIDKICYQYNINSVSIKDRSWEEHDQISTINIVRSRGFLE
jgi:glycosyltransferase involved in cell wall biosynthesis